MIYQQKSNESDECFSARTAFYMAQNALEASTARRMKAEQEEHRLDTLCLKAMDKWFALK